MSRIAPKHLLRPGEVEPAELAGARGGRRWPRRLLIAANVVCLFGLLVMASAYGYVRYRLGEIRTAKCPSCTSTQTTPHGVTVPVSGGLQAENILLIGNETRIGLTPAEQRQYGSSLIYNGTLADIIMILHLDPVDDAASVLSIPRDLFVPMPAGSPVGAHQKMDAALNDGAA
ncbi:MAG TPA: LCP family protein, partial [Acidimicrobiales bacterium]|nr:LCP family protein [Acidimicrobiales bacterium]